MRTAVLVLACLLLAAPTAAVVQNGSSPSNNVGEGELGITSDAGRSDQSFGGEDGPQYQLTLTTTNTTPELMDDRIEDIHRSGRAVEFTGYIQVPTPCHDLITSSSESNHTLTLTVSAESTGEVCVQQVVTKQYRLDLQSTEPFRLEVRHDDTHVRTLETTDYPPEDTGSGGGLLAFFADLWNVIF